MAEEGLTEGWPWPRKDSQRGGHGRGRTHGGHGCRETRGGGGYMDIISSM